MKEVKKFRFTMYECDVCKKRFSSAKMIQDHVDKKHPEFGVVPLEDVARIIF